MTDSPKKNTGQENNSGDTAGKKTLTLKPKLQLSKSEDGQVRQSITRGGAKTTKVVSVEVKKTRHFHRDESGKIIPAEHATPVKEVASSAHTWHEDALSALTDAEKSKRLRALKAATEEKEHVAKAAHEKQLQQEASKAEVVSEKSEYVESPNADANETQAGSVIAEVMIPEPVKEHGRNHHDYKSRDHEESEFSLSEEGDAGDEDGSKRSAVKKAGVKSVGIVEDGRGAGKPKKELYRRQQKLTVTNALDEEERGRSLASIKRAREKQRRKEMGLDQSDRDKVSREIVLPEIITVQDLANRLAERSVDVIKCLMKMGMMVTANQTIDADTAELVSGELGHTVKRVTEADVENIIKPIDDIPEDLSYRSPVVTVMGHVDHGKTSLLDAIRSTDVAASEAGGITQHIGAYRITTSSGQHITFIDTPGHESFTEMRARGAKVTDIVILVVAADDGIKPQTIEAINHAKAAGVPIVVAVNKIDKPDADIKRVKNELLEHELVAEDFGGTIQVIPVSAKMRTNLDALEEAVLLQAEILELKANPKAEASGTVIEAKVDAARGVIATLLVQRGTLHNGDILIVGATHGRVRLMNNDKGQVIAEAGPSEPVEILGLGEVPEAGEQFSVVETEKQARDIAEYRKKRNLDRKVAHEKRGSLEMLFSRAANEGPREVPIIVKADVKGMVEAIQGSLIKLATDEIKIRVIHSGVGGINESDLSLAKASKAIIVGFNVRANPKVKEEASREKLTIQYYSIIYDLVEDMKSIMSGMLSPAKREQYLGIAEIRTVFKVSKMGKVAGCYVSDGLIKRGAGVRLLRDNIVIHEGKLKTLKRFKDDVKEVKSGYECGIAFEDYEDIKEGDVIEAFEVIEEKRSL